MSASLLHALAVGLCCSDTLDVTTGLFVAVIQDVCLFFLFQLQNGQGFGLKLLLLLLRLLRPLLLLLFLHVTSPVSETLIRSFVPFLQ